MNEAETRAQHIDPALKAAGWCVVEGSRVSREYPITPGECCRLFVPAGFHGATLRANYAKPTRHL